MLVLDLFCGTKSLKTFIENKGWEYKGLDIEKKHNPEILIDFLEWDYKSINPDIIWASPDCSCYSMANGGKHFGKDRNPKTEKARTHLKILDKLKECINYHTEKNPNLIYFIENPTARMVWFMTEFPRYDVSYCKYGLDRMTPINTTKSIKKNLESHFLTFQNIHFYHLHQFELSLFFLILNYP